MDSWHYDDTADEDTESDNKFYGGKDAIIFLIDAASPEMHQVPDPDSTDTRLQVALKCVHTTLRKKILGSPNDVVGVLLYGTEKKFRINDFEHLSLVLPLETPEAKSIQGIENYTDDLKILRQDVGEFDSANAANLHEALWQCQSLFNDVTGKVSTRRIWLFTTNDDPHSDSPHLKNQALKKGNDLKDTYISLDVIPFTANFDYSKFYVDIVELEESEMLPSNDTGTEYKPRKLADMLMLVRKRIYKKRSVGSYSLDMGKGVKIAVSTYNLVQRATKPSKMKLTRDTSEEVKTLRQFIDPNTEDPILPTDISKFMEFAKTKIKFTSDEVRSIQKSLLGGTFGLKLICFKKQTQLRWSDFVRSSNFIYPDETVIKGSKNLFAALLHKCHERNVIPICSYKSRQVSMPYFVALDPQMETRDPDDGSQTNPPGFCLFYLPFEDDFRSISSPNLPQFEPTEEQVNAGVKIIKKLKLKNYDVEQFENPTLQAHYRMIESLALFKTDEEDIVDTTMPDFEMQKYRLGDRSMLFNEAVKPTSELIQLVNENTGQKRPCAKSPANGGSKKTKVAEDVDLKCMQAFAEAKKIGSLNIDKLKAFLKAVGVAVNSKMKKGDLVQEVYDYYDGMNAILND